MNVVAIQSLSLLSRALASPLRMLSILVLLVLIPACNNKSQEVQSAPVTINLSEDLLNLVPELGWSDAGIIDRRVLKASSITVNGILFRGDGLREASPRWHFGQYEYEARFRSPTCEFWVYAYTNDQQADVLDVRSAYFKNTDYTLGTELKLYDNIKLGTTTLEETNELPVLGRPSEIGSNKEGTAIIWKYEGRIKRFHRLRFQFDKEGKLARVTWVNG